MIAWAGLLFCAGCGAEPARDPVLVADPPLGASGNAADEGAVQTEIERGVAYIQNEKFAEAKAHFEKAISIKPSASAWTYLGISADRTGDRAGAEKAYKSALELDPTFAEAAQNLAALYLDGGLECARTFFLKFWEEEFERLHEPRSKDPKTQLQEWAQGRGLPLPVYQVTDREGPDHAPSFTVQVTVEGFPAEQAQGRSRQDAEKAAARAMLLQQEGSEELVKDANL